MQLFTKLVMWLVLTFAIEFISIALYGVYESGAGPYQCGFLDSGHYCGINAYIFNKMFIVNLYLGAPTIISGLLSLFIVRGYMRDRHI